MPTMPNQYYTRFDPAKQYEEHMFIAGRGLQSAELVEIQQAEAYRRKAIADAIFKDGDIIRDAVVQLDPLTGETTCGSGALYLRGQVRGVQPATFTIPIVGTFAIGIRLLDVVVTDLEDPELRDPATGTRNYDEPGAARLQVQTAWGWSGDDVTGEFFPVYSATDGVLNAKEPPPNYDMFTQSLARYDRDSTGGHYVVSGMQLKALPDVGANQVYTLTEGRAQVYGYGIGFNTARRLVLAAVPDLKTITNEPHLSTTSGSQRVNFDRSPGTQLTQVAITAEKTVTLTHGVFTGAQDTLPDNSVLTIVEVKQGGTTYTASTDYNLTAGKVDWSPAGAEPAPGSTYTCKYRYITNATPTAVDDDGFTVTGAISGTLILVDYKQKLPRIDRLCITQAGAPTWVIGVSADENPLTPTVPSDMLSVASVLQTWGTDRTVYNDGVRMVPMPKIASFEAKMDLIIQLIAQGRLESNIHTREAGIKKGLFTDPLLDDSLRDAGTPQTAAIVNGLLMLPIDADAHSVGSDIAGLATCAFTHVAALDQLLSTGSMNINPYMSFAPVPARVTLTPAVDRWTVVTNETASMITRRLVGESQRPTWAAGLLNNEAGNRWDTEVSSTVTQLEFLRPIAISVAVTGFGAGEALSQLTFDGVAIAVAPTNANGSGQLTVSFTIPANTPSGNKAVVVTGAGGSVGSAIFTGQGTAERRVSQLVVTTWVGDGFRSAPAGGNSNADADGFVVGPSNAALNAVLGGGGEGGGSDPLAQTFTPSVTRQHSGVDLWFTAAPTTECRVQIRSTATGIPTQSVLAQATLPVGAVAIGGAATRVVFDAPQILMAGTEYAIVVLCDDPVGALAIAELGKFDVALQRWITSQPYTVGVLLSSSNAITWTPHQDRDMKFRLLCASYTQTTRNIALGNVAVTGATDLMLMAFASRPASETGVDFVLTLPDASVVTVSDGQAIKLPAPITGNVGVQARLTGTADFAPILTPGTQLVAGTLASTGTYVSRAVPAAAGGATVKVIFEAQLPSGATITVRYKGADIGDVWSTAIPITASSPANDGFVEFVHSVAGVTEAAVQIKLELSGNTAARPYVRDLRVVTI